MSLLAEARSDADQAVGRLPAHASNLVPAVSPAMTAGADVDLNLRSGDPTVMVHNFLQRTIADTNATLGISGSGSIICRAEEYETASEPDSHPDELGEEEAEDGDAAEREEERQSQTAKAVAARAWAARPARSGSRMPSTTDDNDADSEGSAASADEDDEQKPLTGKQIRENQRSRAFSEKLLTYPRRFYTSATDWIDFEADAIHAPPNVQSLPVSNDTTSWRSGYHQDPKAVIMMRPITQTTAKSAAAVGENHVALAKAGGVAEYGTRKVRAGICGPHACVSERSNSECSTSPLPTPKIPPAIFADGRAIARAGALHVGVKPAPRRRILMKATQRGNARS